MFKDKSIVITGGSSGLGEALASRFLKRGAKIALLARDKSKLESVREKLLKENTGVVEIFSCDVANNAQVEETIASAHKALGGLDVLINSAGVLREGYFEHTALETFREVMDINYFGTLHCIRSALPYLKKSKGRIVNVCSMGGLLGAFGYTAYCSSKFAVHGLSEVLRAELKPQNIKVHCVCPPEFDSPMVHAIEANNRTLENRVIAQTVPTMTVDAVADEALKWIERDRFLIITGATGRILERSNRWIPSLSRLIVDFKIGKIYKGPDCKTKR